MDEAFIIMQIGNEAMDDVCDRAFMPAICDAGLEPRRVDRHNEGDLLKSEIVSFLDRSQIIVADLTNERPNCYLEVGYAMGLGKKKNLILTARHDHHWSSPDFDRDGPRVHFDLEGYDILFWDPVDLPALRTDLAKRIRRRLSVVRPGGGPVVPLPLDSAWRDALRARAREGLTKLGRSGYMEVTAQISPAVAASQSQLLSAMRDSTVSTFGWPIGITLDNRDEYRPRPTVDGVEADVGVGAVPGLDHTSYDFWKVHRDGRFYTLLSLFEDERRADSLFWDTRTVRVTEALLLLVRLYRRLDATDNDTVSVVVRHGGLAGRTLRAANSNRAMFQHPQTTVDEVNTPFSASLGDLEADLPRHVRGVLQQLLVVFDFYSVDDGILDEMIEGFLQGDVK